MSSGTDLIYNESHTQTQHPNTYESTVSNTKDCPSTSPKHQPSSYPITKDIEYREEASCLTKK